MRFFFAVFEDSSQRCHHFEVPYTAPVSSVKRELAERLAQEPSFVAFVYKGSLIPESATFESIAYHRGDSIEVRVADSSNSTSIVEGAIPQHIMKKSPSASELHSRQL